jgi:DNA-binding NtrC family response regulator
MIQRLTDNLGHRFRKRSFRGQRKLALTATIAHTPRSQSELRQRVAAEEKQVIEAALTESGGRVFGPAGAAARLGIARSTLESKIKTLNIDKNRFKVSNPS